MDGLKADASDRGAVMKMLCCAPEKGSKRPANHASHFAIIYENVCPLTGKLMGTHDDGYCSAWS